MEIKQNFHLRKNANVISSGNKNHTASTVSKLYSSNVLQPAS